MLDPAPPRSIDIGDTTGEPMVAGRETLGHLFSRAMEDGREFVRAEVAVVKAKASVTLAAAKGAAIFLGAAVVIALSAVTALLVGLIMTVATLVGPGWATLIVIGVALALAGILGLIGMKRLTAGGEGR